MNTPIPAAQANYGFGADFSTASTAISGQADQSLLDMLKQFLGIDPGDTSKDEELTRAINLAGDATETYLDRVVVARSIDEYFPNHIGGVVLHNFPVDGTVQVVVNLNGVVQTDYFIWLDRNKLGHLSRTGAPGNVPFDWLRFDQVSVTYTAGWEPIPSDLASAIVYTAADFYTSEGTGTVPNAASGAVKGMTIFDVGTLSFDTSSSGGGDGLLGEFGVINPTAAGILTRYKRISV